MLVSTVLPIVLAFIMFSLGLGLRGNDFTRVFQHPKAFAVALFNQLVLLPLVAFALILAVGLPPVLAAGTMILALCPGGVSSNMLTRIANGSPPLSISLTAIASLLSIVIMPFMVVLIVSYFGVDEYRSLNVTTLVIKMFLITTVPVLIGMLLTSLAPKFVEQIAKLVSGVALVLFVLIVVFAIKANWDPLLRHASVLGPVLLTLMIVMLALGLITGSLFKLNSRESTTISLESGIQNATLGLAVAGFVGAEVPAGEVSNSLLPSAVYGVLMYIVVVPFVIWRRRVHSR